MQHLEPCDVLMLEDLQIDREHTEQACRALADVPTFLCLSGPWLHPLCSVVDVTESEINVRRETRNHDLADGWLFSMHNDSSTIDPQGLCLVDAVKPEVFNSTSPINQDPSSPDTEQQVKLEALPSSWLEWQSCQTSKSITEAELGKIHGHNSTVEVEQDKRKNEDAFLLQAKLEGMSYKEIKEKGRFIITESTLRGRYRTLTKSKEARVRKPQWSARDVCLVPFRPSSFRLLPCM